MENKKEEIKYAIPSADMKGAEISKLDKKLVTLKKSVSKKFTAFTVSVPIYKSSIVVSEQIDETDFIIALVQNDFDYEKVPGVELNTPCRFVKGKKGENEYYAIDLFLSKDYRPRLFLSSKIMRTLKICNIELKFEEIALKDSEVARFDEKEKTAEAVGGN